MQTELLKITEYCIHYNIEQSFIADLEESGIISLTAVGPDKFIHEDQFTELDRYVHFYYDLNINIEGIDVLKHMLNRINNLHQRIGQLENRLKFHESGLSSAED